MTGDERAGAEGVGPGVRAFVGLGSNLGDRLGHLSDALRALDALPGVEVVAVSRAVESEPWGVTGQPPFTNAVAELKTDLSPEALLDALLGIEDSLGRQRGERYGPRVIDLDLLLYAEETRRGERLVLPHPRLTEREFVVRPLLEIAPHARLPGGREIDPAAARAGRVLAVLGPVPGFEHLTPVG